MLISKQVEYHWRVMAQIRILPWNTVELTISNQGHIDGPTYSNGGKEQSDL
jgi:hypothetical protein